MPANSGRSPLRVGEPAIDFTLPDAATGEPCAFYAYRAGRDTLLVFFRGTWCPFCREQMRVLRENHERLRAADIAVVGVVCQGRESVRRYLETAPLPFPLLTDESRDVARAYGVHYRLSLEGVNLAHPSVYVIDRADVVTFAHIGRNMRDLPVTTVIERFAAFLPTPAP